LKKYIRIRLLDQIGAFQRLDYTACFLPLFFISWILIGDLYESRLIQPRTPCSYLWLQPSPHYLAPPDPARHRPTKTSPLIGPGGAVLFCGSSLLCVGGQDIFA